MVETAHIVEDAVKIREWLRSCVKNRRRGAERDPHDPRIGWELRRDA